MLDMAKTLCGMSCVDVSGVSERGSKSLIVESQEPEMRDSIVCQRTLYQFPKAVSVLVSPL